jgi:hypothetical protein
MAAERVAEIEKRFCQFMTDTLTSFFPLLVANSPPCLLIAERQIHTSSTEKAAPNKNAGSASN